MEVAGSNASLPGPQYFLLHDSVCLCLLTNEGMIVGQRFAISDVFTKNIEFEHGIDQPAA